MRFPEAYFSFRNRLRRFSRDSLLDAALKTLRAPYKDKLEALRAAPAQTLLLVKWVLQDRMLDRSGSNPAISQKQFDELRQLLWELPDSLELESGPERPLYLFMRQLLRPQLGFQMSLDPGFVREAALLNSLTADHWLRTLWAAKTNLTLDDFMAMQYCTFVVTNGANLSFNRDVFAPVTGALSSGAVDAFVRLVARTIPELAAFVRALPDAQDKRQSELFEFPVVSRFPFVATGPVLHCWHPAVLYRGLENLAHNVLAEEGQQYTDAFSRVFERHVVSEAQSLGGAFYSETDIQSWIGLTTQAPDALLSYPDCNVWVESKAGIFDETVMAVGHNEMFLRKTRALQKATSQAWAASHAIRGSSAAPSPVRRTTQDYLLIVTNRELSAGRGTMLASMYPSGTLVPDKADALQHLPLEHIYVLSIADFERVASAVRDGHLELPNFVRACVAADENSSSARIYMHQHLDAMKIPRGRSKIVDEALKRCERRLIAALAPPIK